MSALRHAEWQGILLCLWACMACAAPEKTDAPAPRAQPVVTADGFREETYQLSTKDIVRVTVFQEDDLTTIARVGKDGTISFPLIGRAKVGGKTIHEAAQIVQSLLKEYLVHPQVTVSIVDYVKRHFIILGQVGRPGTIAMPDDETVNLLEAIGMAGGYTRIADSSKIILKRQVDGQEKLFKLNANKMLKDPRTEQFEVLPGDTIVVGETLF